MFAVTVLAGCAAGVAAPPTKGESAIGASGPVFSQDISNQTFLLRRQAAELRAMAKRFEVEAAWYAQQVGQDSEQAKRSRDIAKQLSTEADQTDQRIREYRQQMPHNLVY